MRALKILVGVMSVLLIIGVVVLVWGVTREAGKLARGNAPPPVETMAASAAGPVIADERTPWGEIGLGQPAGSRIQAVTAAGDLIVLHLYTGAPGTDERLLVIEPAGGTLLGTLAVTKAK
ncbi:MAG: hypothetical protein HY057_14610 [Rhodospirillales bacterium]|nr:hypothetical protein [Rhodospirillales bacterium]